MFGTYLILINLSPLNDRFELHNVFGYNVNKNKYQWYLFFYLPYVIINTYTFLNFGGIYDYSKKSN